MELKRTLTKHMRRRRSAAPDNIEMPAKHSIFSSPHSKKNKGDNISDHSSSIVAPPTVTTPLGFPGGNSSDGGYMQARMEPSTPTTPAVEEFASIPFSGFATPPAFNSPHGSGYMPSLPQDSVAMKGTPRSTRTSRSTSVASSSPFTPITTTLEPGTPASVYQHRKSTLDSALDQPMWGAELNWEGEPMSPESFSESEVSEADEMASQILAKVHEGGQREWSF